MPNATNPTLFWTGECVQLLNLPVNHPFVRLNHSYVFVDQPCRLGAFSLGAATSRLYLSSIPLSPLEVGLKCRSRAFDVFQLVMRNKPWRRPMASRVSGFFLFNPTGGFCFSCSSLLF
jgi:hypothetical protein